MRRAALALLLGFLVVSHPAAAANFYQCANSTTPVQWPSSSLLLRAGANSFPANAWRTELVAAIDAWETGTVDFDVELVTGDAQVGINNDESEVWFDAGLTLPATTARVVDCSAAGTFTEIDIRFRQTWPFVAPANKPAMHAYGGNGRHFRAVAVHELGHALGLDHTSHRYNVMGDPETHVNANGPFLRPYAGVDATAGAVTLYGAGPLGDLSVSHWRFGFASGAYSQHLRTRVEEPNGIELQLASGGSEPRFQVTSGQEIRPAFTFENAGGSALPGVKVRFYLSSNDTITTADTPLDDHSIDLAAHASKPTPLTVRLPQLAPGSRHFLGVIIDPFDLVSEADEANNATYVELEVREALPQGPLAPSEPILVDE